MPVSPHISVEATPTETLPISPPAPEVLPRASLLRPDSIGVEPLASRLSHTISFAIAATCVVVFVSVAALDIADIVPREQVFLRFGLSYDGVLGHWRVYQFVTAPLLHGGFFQLIFNMLALITLGPNVEKALGRVRYLELSAISGFASMAVFLMLTRETGQIGFGYSDVLFGVFVAQAVYFPEQTVMVYGVFPMKMKYTVVVLAAIVLYTSASQRGGVPELAHFAGAATVWFYLRRQK